VNRDSFVKDNKELLKKIIENQEIRIKIGQNSKEKIQNQFGLNKIAQKFSNTINYLIKI